MNTYRVIPFKNRNGTTYWQCDKKVGENSWETQFGTISYESAEHSKQLLKERLLEQENKSEEFQL